MDMEPVNRSLASPAPDAEVRHATVVKCDIVGSTRLKRGLDLDGQLAFKRGLEATITYVAARHAGYVEQFEGDGALVFFGYPEAREDAPESAVRMGLEMVDAIASASFVPGVRLQIRVGIASGPLAVLKGPRVEKGEPYVGLIIDMAERLRALADPDRVVTCDNTKRLAARFFEYDDLGIVQAKGFEDGVRAWRVVRKSSVVSRFDAQRYDESSGEIIGRSDVLARLSEAWSDARGGKGRTVCLVGDAGIGKSRLAKAALDLAALDGATVLNIDCMPSTGNTPLFPIGMLLRRVANITVGASESEKRGLAAELLARFLAASDVPSALSDLAPLFGLEAAPIPVDQTPDQVRDRTISIVVRVLRALAAQGPSVLLCEDLHWADDTTASIVERLADEIADLGVLMIITARPESDRLPNPAKATSILLPPLDSATSVDLVRSVAKGTALSEDLIQRIVDRCEGVPLLLEEVTRSTVETANGAEDVRIDAKSAGAVPTPLQLVVESRLGRLPDLEFIAQAASVLGREFSVAVLEQMVPDEQSAKVAEALTLFIRHGLFAPASSASDRARFRHVMICEAVHDTLLGRDRRRLHSHAADILRSGYLGTPDAAPDVLAEHLRVAERWVECIQTRLAASGDTAAQGAYVETEGHCDAALKLIDKVGSPEQRRELQFKLQVQLGVALTGKEGYASPKVESAYRSAEAVCGEGAEAEKLYPIIRGLATLNLVRGKLATAYSLSQQGLTLAERSNRPEFRIDALSVQCYTTLYYGRLADCRTWIERCLTLYREEQGDGLTYPVPQDAATAALALLPTVAWLLGDAHAAEDAIREGLAHVERLNRDFDRALLHTWIAGTRYTQRRYDEAEEHAHKAAAISQAVAISHQPRYREWYATGLLMSLLARAARSAAPDCVLQATEMCTAFAREGVGLNASYYLWGLALGSARMGDRQTAQHMLAEAFRRAEASEESRMNAELLILGAELEPDEASAQRLLARALHIADEEGAVATSLRAAVAMVLRSGGAAADLETARMTLDLLDGRAPYPAQRGWMHERLARLRRGLDPQLGTAPRT
jgi:class 3 adenylate cyclase/tetratricopeptide (TPR) repeat protein